MTTNKIILEIRAGAGGDEAAIFAGDLARMYQRYAATRGWTFTILDKSETTLNGYKSLTAEIKGEGVYDAMKRHRGANFGTATALSEEGWTVVEELAAEVAQVAKQTDSV